MNWYDDHDTDALDTPYLAVDLDILEANIARQTSRAASLGVALRPHAKTHKCAQIAHRQIASGAVGLTVATISEAEAFTNAGITDLFIAYPLWLTASKGERLRRLSREVSLRLAVDSVESANAMATALSTERSRVQVVVEVDSGQHRTGAKPDEAGSIAAHAQSLGLDVAGVFTFPGHGYGPDRRAAAAKEEAQALTMAADSLRAEGIDPVVRSGGSTPTIAFADPGVLTEIRPGVYPFNDAQQVELGTVDMADVALTAVATVVHRNGTRILVDAGSKILGADRSDWASGFGRLLLHIDARIVALSEHHATIEMPEGSQIRLGDEIRLVPNHVCSAVNLVDELVVTRSGSSHERWKVIARGANT
ncbi:alanine racemase [Rhodococcus fascians]|nr:alanine racemase [Rhodococcus fascians]